MQVICAGCGTSYELGPEYAGKRVRCRACQAVIQVPGLGPAQTATPPASPAGPAAELDPYRSPMEPGAGPQPSAHPYSADRAAAFETHRRLVGTFNIIVGVLSLLWAGVAAFVTFAVLAVGEEIQDPGDPPIETVVLFYLVISVLSLIVGILQLAAGVKVLKGSAGARSMGLVSGFISCASMWGCCVYPFCLGSGIYTLVILFGQDARTYLETRRRLR